MAAAAILKIENLEHDRQLKNALLNHEVCYAFHSPRETNSISVEKLFYF
jgi:hypothetical protein